jgi:short-subunit dehydrogenase
MRSLVVGGTSGLGLEIAKLLKKRGDEVIITGRKNPEIKGLQFQKLRLDTGQDLAKNIEAFVEALPLIDTFVYSAGFYQEGTLTDLGDQDIARMLDVGMHAPIWFTRELLQNQGEIKELIAITSTAQFVPRDKEIIYGAVKAGFAQFVNSLSLDARVKKVLVAAPGGIKTKFWQATRTDTSTFNDPSWVAREIVDALRVNFGYALVKILRDPARTEVIETR